MAKSTQLIDFCKTGIKKVARSFNLGAPLDTVTPVGLNSLGCQPLVSHRQTGTQGILSQVKQDKGTFVRSLLTTTSDTGLVGSEQDLPYGAMIAGVAGPAPVSGSATSPFPTLETTTHLLWTVGGAAFTQTLNGHGQDLGGDSTAFDRSSGASQVGFGGILTGSSGGNTLVQLPPDSREYGGGVHLRSNHHYIPYLSLPYSPLLEPLLYSFNSTFGYFIIPGFQDIAGDNGTCQVQGYGAPVAPCLTTANGDFTLANPNEPNGPSLHRRYNLFRLTPFDMPGYGGDFTGTWDVARTNLRGFMCVYVDSSRIDSVTLHEGGSLGASGVVIPVPGNGPPSAFTPILPGIAFDTVYQFSILGNEPTYTFDVTRGAVTITTTPQALFTGSAHIRCFEVFLDMSKSGNPALACS